MNFYSKISAFILCAGLISRIVLLGIDSYFRYANDDFFSWKYFIHFKSLVTSILIYNPVIIFTLPLFAIVCDWTEALILLNNPQDISQEHKKAVSKRIKRTFLSVSIFVIIAMWANIAVQFLSNFKFQDNVNKII